MFPEIAHEIRREIFAKFKPNKKGVSTIRVYTAAIALGITPNAFKKMIKNYIPGRSMLLDRLSSRGYDTDEFHEFGIPFDAFIEIADHYANRNRYLSYRSKMVYKALTDENSSQG